jgi:hypothetical protein
MLIFRGEIALLPVSCVQHLMLSDLSLRLIVLLNMKITQLYSKQSNHCRPAILSLASSRCTYMTPLKACKQLCTAKKRRPPVFEVAK